MGLVAISRFKEIFVVEELASSDDLLVGEVDLGDDDANYDDAEENG